MTTMSFNEYVEVMKDALVSTGVTVTLEQGFLSNGNPVSRLAVRKDGNPVAMAFRISELYQEYLNNPDVIEDQISSIKSQYDVPEEITLFSQNILNGTFETIKDNIVFSILNKEFHKDYLSTVPHVDHLDLSIVFLIHSGENHCTPVTNSLMDMWGVTVKELWEYANQNTVKIGGVDIMELPGPMFGITNSSHYKGAGILFDPKVLYGLSETHHCNFYIIPSSIHEIIAMPEENIADLDRLRLLVKEVNSDSKIISPEDVLSNNIYYYDRYTNQITFA